MFLSLPLICCLLLAFNYKEIRAFIGRCIEDEALQYGAIVERRGTLREIYNATLSRLVNTMGLHLFELWEGGKIPIPRYL